MYDMAHCSDEEGSYLCTFPVSFYVHRIAYITVSSCNILGFEFLSLKRTIIALYPQNIKKYHDLNVQRLLKCLLRARRIAVSIGNTEFSSQAHCPTPNFDQLL